MRFHALTRFERTRIRAGRLRKHETGDLDRLCDTSNRSYTCPGCGQCCCYCFGGAPDPRCDDCVAEA